MLGQKPTDLTAFNRQVVALLELDELLDYALPSLQLFFQRYCRASANLRLGLYEQLQTQTKTIRQLSIRPNARIQAFGSRVPGWNEASINLDVSDLATTAFLHQYPAYLDKEEQVQPFPTNQAVWLSRMAVPLIGAASKIDETEALLEVEFKEHVEVIFTGALQETLLIFGTALANAQRYDISQRTINQLKALRANTADLLTQPRLDSLLEVTVLRAMSMLDSDGGNFYMTNAENREVECIVDFSPSHDCTGMILQFGEGVAGQVADAGEHIIVDSYRHWEGRSPQFENIIGEEAILSVPVFWKDGVIGALSVIRSTPERVFTQQDAELLSLFAGQTAAAISNSRLLEETLRSKRELELLYQVAAILNNQLEQKAVCQVFIDQLAEKFGYSSSFIYVRDTQGRQMLEVERGYPDIPTELDRQLGICGRVMRTFQAQLVTDVRHEPDFIYILPNVTSGIYVPIMYGSELLGVIGVEAAGVHLREADLRLLQTLSSHLSVAIKNASLFRQVEQQATQMRHRNQELEAVFGGLNEGLLIVSVNEGEQQLQMNPEGLRLLGWGDYQPSMADLNHQGAYEISLPTTTARALQENAEVSLAPRLLARRDWPDLRALRGEKFSGLELLVTGRDKQRRCLSFSGAPLYGEQDDIVQAVIVFHDMTALRAVENMKDGFLSLVSHDLRSPLAAIAGYTENVQYMLENETPNSMVNVKRNLDIISRHTQRLNRLVTDLLDMARLESGRMQMDLFPYNLAALIPDVCTHLIEAMPDKATWKPDPENPRRCILRLELGLSLPKVLLDQQRFDQVLTNLLSNSVKYSDKGGEVLVRLAMDPNDENSIRLTIKDQGIGIEPEKIPHLFSRFYRTEQARQGGFAGTGLGLYICHLMVEALNGRIWAESEGLGHGTTFHLSLPIVQAVKTLPPPKES